MSNTPIRAALQVGPGTGLQWSEVQVPHESDKYCLHPTVCQPLRCLGGRVSMAEIVLYRSMRQVRKGKTDFVWRAPPFPYSKHIHVCIFRILPSDPTASFVDGQGKKAWWHYLSDDRGLDGSDLVTPGSSRFLGTFQAGRFLRKWREGILVSWRVTLLFWI
jgi:hypothetical protein